MQAVLFICHGSRVRESCEEAATFIEDCRRDLTHIPIVEYCFLELSSPTIAEGFQKCVEQGATKIAVIPFLLLTAAHAVHDIPLELEKQRALYSDVIISYGEPIGISARMSQLLLDKIKETNSSSTNLHIVIVGRGSSMLEVKEQLGRVVSVVEEQYDNVSTCFLTACEPFFEETLYNVLQYKHSTVVVIPYLIFSGILTRTIEKTVVRMSNPNSNVIITAPLRTHSNVRLALLDRVAEVV